MSSSTKSGTSARSTGRPPSRTTVVHTLPATGRPGRRTGRGARSADAVPSMPARRPVMGVVPLGAVDDHARTALSTAWSMLSGSRLVAVHVNDGPEDEREFIRRWELWEPGIPLALLTHLPFAGDPVATSIADYLARRHRAYQTMVVITDHERPSAGGRRAGPTRSDALQAALLPLPHVVVCRQRLDRAPAARGARD